MKPTLTPEQSAALNSALRQYGKSGTLRLHAQDTNGWLAYMSMDALNGLDLLTLAAALTNGVELAVFTLRETNESTG